MSLYNWGASARRYPPGWMPPPQLDDPTGGFSMGPPSQKPLPDPTPFIGPPVGGPTMPPGPGSVPMQPPTQLAPGGPNPISAMNAQKNGMFGPPQISGFRRGTTSVPRLPTPFATRQAHRTTVPAFVPPSYARGTSDVPNIQAPFQVPRAFGTDTVPAMLSPEEGVVNADGAAIPGVRDWISKINAMGLHRYGSGTPGVEPTPIPGAGQGPAPAPSGFIPGSGIPVWGGSVGGPIVETPTDRFGGVVGGGGFGPPQLDDPLGGSSPASGPAGTSPLRLDLGALASIAGTPGGFTPGSVFSMGGQTFFVDNEGQPYSTRGVDPMGSTSGPGPTEKSYIAAPEATGGGWDAKVAHLAAKAGISPEDYESMLSSVQTPATSRQYITGYGPWQKNPGFGGSTFSVKGGGLGWEHLAAPSPTKRGWYPPIYGSTPPLTPPVMPTGHGRI